MTPSRLHGSPFLVWLKERAIPLKSGRGVIAKFLRYLAETFGIVSVDIDPIPPKFDDGHCFVLACINKKTYIIDSYALVRKPEMREFDFESFDDYVTTGSIDSYNKTFNTHIKGDTALGQCTTERTLPSVGEGAD